MTLKPSKPQKKYRARTKKLGKQPLHIGDTLPPLSDGTLRTAADVFPDWKKLGASMDEVYFAAEYLLNGFNASEAARYVHPEASPNSWGSFGSQYLRRPIVQQLLNDYTSAWLRGKAFELEHNLMETLEALAFYDVSRFLNPDGTLAFKNWNELPEPLRRCVEGVEVKFFGANAQRQTVSLQLAKRADALKAIANYVAIMRNGPLAQGASNGASVSAEAELVLNAVFNSGRKLDRRTPAQIRADKAREEVQAADVAAMPENAVSFSGLG